jgi:hypothetical protein
MRFVAVIASVVLCLGLTAAPAHALTPQKQKKADASQQVPLDQLPSAITSAIQKAYPTGHIVTAYKLSRGTDVRYQLFVKETPDAQAVVMTATPDGKIANGKKGQPARKGAVTPTPSAKTAATPNSAGDPIAIDQLPKTVTKAVKDAYPKDTIIQAFKKTTGAEVVYQVVLEDVSSAQPLRVTVSADGKIQKR